MQKQKDLDSKSWNMPSETVSRQLSNHTPSRHESFEDNVPVSNTEEFQCPPQSTFDNAPLPTTRVRAPRKVCKYFVIPNLCYCFLSKNFGFR